MFGYSSCGKDQVCGRTAGKCCSQSFTMNMFRGQSQLNQVFPFPEPMTEEQTETVQMLIDPMEKFYEEINDPAKNDQNVAIDEKTTAALWELRACALQNFISKDVLIEYYVTQALRL